MSAVLSQCGTYRYILGRPPLNPYPSKGTAVFCMLNPSTADAELDDPTIRRCRAFADSWDCNGIVVVNLYALRATDPRALIGHEDPFGPDNLYYLQEAARVSKGVVCAWGANAARDPVAVKMAVQAFRSMGASLYCLGTTKDGHPKHPLYLKGTTPLVDWSPPA